MFEKAYGYNNDVNQVSRFAKKLILYLGPLKYNPQFQDRILKLLLKFL